MNVRINSHTWDMLVGVVSTIFLIAVVAVISMLVSR
jgi:hypothetical protein